MPQLIPFDPLVPVMVMDTASKGATTARSFLVGAQGFVGMQGISKLLAVLALLSIFWMMVPMGRA